MNKKIFRHNLLSSLIVLFVSLVLVSGVLFDYFEAQIFNELKSEADYISYALNSEGTEFISNFNGSDKRITLIADDGTVLADTSAVTSKLDNHSDRREIRDAILNGSGKSTRYSDTLMQKTLYYALRLSDGSILRVSTTQSSVLLMLLGLLQPLIFIVLVALAVSLFLSYRVSKAIIKPINALDLDNPTDNEAYEELTPLLKKLSAQKKTIDRQIKEAKQRQEEFVLITENMSEGLLIIDSQANLLSSNRAADRLLEIDGADQKSVLTFNRTKEFRETVKKALSGESVQCGLLIEENSYSLIASPVYDGKKIIGAVIVIIDITESAKREQLRREFTSNVSHELKTPLTSISGFAEMLKQGDCSNETVIDFSTSIYDEAQRLITLVNDIIKISELDENSTRFETERVDLSELASDVIRRLKPIAQKHGITLNLIGESAHIKGTKKILDEMLYNLCDNAIKYNKENGTVDVIINSSESKVTLSVRDTGIGIPPDEQSRVFERFYRVDKSHSKLVGGTGLGLAIVKHAALCHNAQIQLDSVLDKGTIITVSFNKE